ncbi:DNA ligase [Salmonella phage 38]|uniref:DNA ligase n=1 Tax=Salmonella phage 38 TaxID=1654891 RepID=A0A0N7CF28_9CAUD|nr:DNA ligase [Salmonella phage 38]AKJ73821.1 DNA ligase [Salmonella phage 38]
MMAERKIGGMKADQELAKAATNIHPDYHTLIQIILDRDIKAGIAEKGINAAFNAAGGTGRLINILPYHRYDNMTIDLLKKMDFKRGVFSQLKSDGMFANIICRYGRDPEIRSRSGSLIAGGSVDNLSLVFKDLIYDAGIGESVFHGELLVIDLKTNTVLPRAIGNGKLNSVIQTGEPLEDRYKVIYRVWDVVPYDNWFNAQRVDTPYERRFDIIQQLFEGDDGLVQVQETRVVHSFEEAVEHFKDALARREEGTICKAADMPWEDGTSSEGLKLKWK